MQAALDLRRAAREIFDAALAGADAGRAVRRVVRLDGSRLYLPGAEFDLQIGPIEVYSIAIGKAAHAMACALDEILGDRLTGGIISTPPDVGPISPRWQRFAGGHPTPNESSLRAARAAFNLLERANKPSALVVFLISGGGSAMLEWPRDQRISLDDLQEANRALVSCGASIAEVNAVRRAFSSVKGGGLSSRAPHAAQVTLIISDTGPGHAANVASGPTLPPPADELDVPSIISRYRLDASLPAPVLDSITNRDAPTGLAPDTTSLRLHHVLLDNESALQSAARAAETRGFVVEIARDIVEQPVDVGSIASVSRLFEMRQRSSSKGQAVCIVSGGEFACPVRGEGTGGRNSETALRCALEIDARGGRLADEEPHVVALSAGTDGIDGNSPAAGALADDTTISRARTRGLDARASLEASDAYTFFRTLGDAIMTGPTGTNVRDVRVLLAR